MSAAKNVKDKDPSLASILLTGLIVAGLSAFLGFLFLASNQPKGYKSVAELQSYLEENPELELLDRSYFEGAISRSRSWESKRDALLNGSHASIELSAGELNAWMSSKFRKPRASADDEEEAGVLLLPGVPNFFIDAEEGFFFNLPTVVLIYGSQYECVIVVRGHFSAGTPVEFEIDSMRVNNAALPVVGGLGDQMVGALLKAYSQSDDFLAFQKAWQKVDSVEMLADSIRLKLR